MSEFTPKETRESKIAKIADALSTGGISLFYPEAAMPQRNRPVSKAGKFFEALATGGFSLIYPRESGKAPEQPNDSHDINRLAP